MHKCSVVFGLWSAQAEQAGMMTGSSLKCILALSALLFHLSSAQSRPCKCVLLVMLCTCMPCMHVSCLAGNRH